MRIRKKKQEHGEIINSHLPAHYSTEKQNELANKWKQHGDLVVRNELFKTMLRLIVWNVSRRIYTNRDDAFQYVAVYTIQAFDSFDESLGNFSTWFTQWVNAGIKSYKLHNSSNFGAKVFTTQAKKAVFQSRTFWRFRDILTISELTKKINEEGRQVIVTEEDVEHVHKALQIPIQLDKPHYGDPDDAYDKNYSPLSVLVNSETSEDLFIAAEQKELQKALFLKAFQILTERERDIIRNYTLKHEVGRGTQESRRKNTLRAVGRKWNISRERVRQIQEIAIKKMQDYVKARLAND